MQPFFGDDEIALLGLNTARSATFSNGRISHAQAAAIKSVFADVPADHLRILAIHHPLAVPGAVGELLPVGRAAMARRAIIEAGVGLVLSGHFHRQCRYNLGEDVWGEVPLSRSRIISGAPGKKPSGCG